MIFSQLPSGSPSLKLSHFGNIELHRFNFKIHDNFHVGLCHDQRNIFYEWDDKIALQPLYILYIYFNVPIYNEIRFISTLTSCQKIFHFIDEFDLCRVHRALSRLWNFFQMKIKNLRSLTLESVHLFSCNTTTHALSRQKSIKNFD